MSNKNNNQLNIPQAKAAMVKKNCPIRTLTFHRATRIAQGHQISVQYAARIGV